MKLIKNGDSRVTKIINKKSLKNEAEYRVSQYVHTYSCDGRYLIAHMLSYEVIELTQQEWDAVKKIEQAPVSSEYLTEKGLEQLALSAYIVEKDHNDLKQYEQLVFLLKTMAGKKKGTSSYTILPTTGCNARCIYCYEEGYEIKTMTKETSDRLVDYICETRHDDTVKLMWFGGEPLANVRAIRDICMGLKERGVPYKSKMITNASLMTKELAHEAKELWNMTKVQVSLDGAREDYEKRKRYASPDKYNYDRVLEAVGYLADEDIKVVLRCNYDKDNTAGLKEMVDDIAERFDKNVSLYFHILFQQNDKDDYVDQIKAIDGVCDYAESKGLMREGALKGKLRTNFCMADSECSVVVAPDGTLYDCEHLPEGRTWGNIFDGVTDEAKFREMRAAKPIEKECAECKYISFCTGFRKKNCPDIPKYCREDKEIGVERYLRALINSCAECEDEDEEL